MSFKPQLIENVKAVNNFIQYLKSYIGPNQFWQLGFFKKIKVLYYTHWKFPRIKKKLLKFMVKDLDMICKEPIYFFPSLLEYVVILASIQEANKEENIIDFIEKRFSNILKTRNPIKQLVFHLDSNNKAIVKYNLVVRNISPITKYYKGNVVQVETECDLQKQTAVLESTIFDSKDPDNPGDNIIARKTFSILANGKIYNPNYALSKDLEKEEQKEYINLIFFILAPLMQLVISLCMIDFVYVKRKK